MLRNNETRLRGRGGSRRDMCRLEDQETVSSQPKETGPTLEFVLGMARSLSPIEKLQLIERLAPDLEAALRSPSPAEKRSLEGFLGENAISDADIEEARREMWGAFPRGDI